MKRRELRALLILLITAAIWGFAFAAQREASRFLQPFTFGALRFFLGAAVLYPLSRKADQKMARSGISKSDFRSGALVGAVLFVASVLQQLGISTTSAGQAGFLSALYVVLVPVIGVAFKRKTSRATWISLLLSVPALYLLCMTDKGFKISEGDAWVLVSAVFWALHILTTDRCVLHHDPMHLCVSQFLVCGALNLVCALIFEKVQPQALLQSFWPVMYVGVMSTAVAYTLQAVGQRDAKPAHAALIMSMESVFSVIGGAIFLSEKMSVRAYLGCALMFAAVVLSQLGASNTEDKAHV